MKILITGATGCYGGVLAEDLKSDHEIYTLQRTPCRSITEENRWIDCNLSKPSETPLSVQDLVIEKVRLDAVVHCALSSGKGDETWTHWYDFQEALQVNVVEPCVLTKYLLDFGVLSWSGVAVFLLDSREFGPENTPLATSKGALTGFVNAFSSNFPVTFEHRFVGPQPFNRLGAAKQFCRWIREKGLIYNAVPSKWSEYL